MIQPFTSKSIWKKIPLLCVFLLVLINTFSKRFNDTNQLIIILVVLAVSLISTVMWMREEHKNGKLKKSRVFLLLALATITFVISMISYFLAGDLSRF